MKILKMANIWCSHRDFQSHICCFERANARRPGYLAPENPENARRISGTPTPTGGSWAVHWRLEALRIERRSSVPRPHQGSRDASHHGCPTPTLVSIASIDELNIKGALMRCITLILVFFVLILVFGRVPSLE